MILGTGCRTFFPGQWTYNHTSAYGNRFWDSFDDAEADCAAIGGNDGCPTPYRCCGSLHQYDPSRYTLRGGIYFSADYPPVPNSSHYGAWLQFDTRSTYCIA